jgi:hypothetical protein
MTDLSAAAEPTTHRGVPLVEMRDIRVSWGGGRPRGRGTLDP